jgi:hypothetical protein
VKSTVWKMGERNRQNMKEKGKQGEREDMKIKI